MAAAWVDRAHLLTLLAARLRHRSSAPRELCDLGWRLLGDVVAAVLLTPVGLVARPSHEQGKRRLCEEAVGWALGSAGAAGRVGELLLSVCI